MKRKATHAGDTPSEPAGRARDPGRLQNVARLLRESPSIDPESHRTLAELVDELTRALETKTVPPAEVTHLAESTAHLAENLHQQQEKELPVTVTDRLSRAALNAEAHAPIAAGLAHRLLEALANIGI